MNYKQRLKDIREDKDLTQKQIAIVLKTSQSYYAQYENESKNRKLPTEHLITLCKFYNLSADYILGFTDEPRPLPKK